ncbi:MAG: hypothetical protein ACI841_001042 [Planctomycetota bacterium]
MNDRGDVLITFSGSSTTEFIETYFAGRYAHAFDGFLSDPVLIRAGAGAQNPSTGFRGLTTDCTRDPIGGSQSWAAGLYGRMSNRWGTQIAKVEFPFEAPEDFYQAQPNPTRLVTVA